MPSVLLTPSNPRRRADEMAALAVILVRCLIRNLLHIWPVQLLVLSQ